MPFRRFHAPRLACALACSASLTLASAAFATPNVAMDSAIFVERMHPGNLRSLEPASRLSPGERIVTVVSWYRLGGDGGFTITNPLPRAIAYQASGADNEEVSVDGGRTWGKLGDLRVNGHVATPEDVTHVRWRISASSAAHGRGDIAYSGIVR